MEKLLIPSILSANDAAIVSKKVLDVLEPYNGNDTKINRLYFNMQPIHERLMKNLKSSNKSQLTEVRFSSDKKRDLGYLSFKNIVYGMSISIIDEVSAKAKPILSVLERLGIKVYELSYNDETATLRSLFKELDQDQYQLAMNELGITRFYDSLKEAQDAFDVIDNQKNGEHVFRLTETEAATDIVKELFPALIKLITLVQLYSETDPDTYSGPFNQIVASIYETNSAARAAITRKENGSDTTPEPKK